LPWDRVCRNFARNTPPVWCPEYLVTVYTAVFPQPGEHYTQALKPGLLTDHKEIGAAFGALHTPHIGTHQKNLYPLRR
jgi:hypothetical protein